MTSANPLVPDGISHEVDLSGMTPGDRRKHHTQELRRIAKWQGLDGVKAYKARWPEAADILVDSEPRAYVRKPAGYRDAILSRVALWFDSDTALAASNRDDVARLNERLGSDFDPDRFFSRALSPSLLASVAELFADRGRHLDTGKTKSMSQVRQAVRSAKAQGATEGKPFANVGTRTAQSLTIGNRTFRLEDYRGRECIRVTHDGVTQRLYLGSLLEVLGGLQQGGTGEPVPPSILEYTGDLVSGDKEPSRDGGDACPETSSHINSHISESGDRSHPHIQDAGNVTIPHIAADPSLTDRLATLKADRLAAETAAQDRFAAAQSAAAAAGRDILDI